MYLISDMVDISSGTQGWRLKILFCKTNGMSKIIYGPDKNEIKCIP